MPRCILKTSTRKINLTEVWMAGQIGADSVKYNSIDAFVGALGIPRKDLCLKCWDGVSPIKDDLLVKI